MKPIAVTLALFATVSLVAQAPDPAAAPPAPGAHADATTPKPVFPTKPNPFATTADIYQQSIDRAPASQTESPPADPEVLELPKMTVKQQPKPRPRLNATDTRAIILGPKAFNEELAKKNLTALDRGVLNKFTIPAWLGGVSAAERAREEHNLQQKRQFLDDVLTISKAAEQADPANARALREAAGKP